MKRLCVSVLVCAALVASLVACGGKKDAGAASGAQAAAPATKIVMKISHVSAPGSARDLGCHKIADVVMQMTNGQVDAQVYPSSQLGGQRDQVEGAQFGTIECVVVPTSYLGGIAPMMTLLDTPYLLPDDPELLYKLYQSDAVRKLLDTTLEKGIYTMAIWQTGYKAWSANKSLVDPAGMKGLKVRVMNSPILFKQAEILGATGITMDFGETYGALQNKTIDGQENPIDTIYDMKFNEVQTDITFTNHAGLDQVVMFNKTWFDALPQNVQAAIVEGVKQGGRVCLEKTLELAKKDTQLILDTGKTKLHYLTPEQLTKWHQAVAPVQQFARTSMGEKGTALYDGIVAARKEIAGK